MLEKGFDLRMTVEILNIEERISNRRCCAQKRLSVHPGNQPKMDDADSGLGLNHRPTQHFLRGPDSGITQPPCHRRFAASGRATPSLRQQIGGKITYPLPSIRRLAFTHFRGHSLILLAFLPSSFISSPKGSFHSRENSLSLTG